MHLKRGAISRRRWQWRQPQRLRCCSQCITICKPRSACFILALDDHLRACPLPRPLTLLKKWTLHASVGLLALALDQTLANPAHHELLATTPAFYVHPRAHTVSFAWESACSPAVQVMLLQQGQAMTELRGYTWLDVLLGSLQHTP